MKSASIMMYMAQYEGNIQGIVSYSLQGNARPFQVPYVPAYPRNTVLSVLYSVCPHQRNNIAICVVVFLSLGAATRINVVARN
jgi:hypothetical protein